MLKVLPKRKVIRSRDQSGELKIWHFNVANGRSTVDLRRRIASGVARCGTRGRVSSCQWRYTMRLRLQYSAIYRPTPSLRRNVIIGHQFVNPD